MIESLGVRYPHLKQLFTEALQHVEGVKGDQVVILADSTQKLAIHGRQEQQEDETSSASDSSSNQGEQRLSLNGRSGLDIEEAKVIFCAMPTGKRKVTRTSKLLGAKYGVSPKTIRDIWNKRTWVHATVGLWSKEEQLSHCKVLCDNCATSVGTACMLAGQCACRKKLGRPSGARDKKPRKRRGLGFSGISAS
eukprot:760511-Hanusia_phi.AAC.1